VFLCRRKRAIFFRGDWQKKKKKEKRERKREKEKKEKKKRESLAKTRAHNLCAKVYILGLRRCHASSASLFPANSLSRRRRWPSLVFRLICYFFISRGGVGSRTKGAAPSSERQRRKARRCERSRPDGSERWRRCSGVSCHIPPTAREQATEWSPRRNYWQRPLLQQSAGLLVQQHALGECYRCSLHQKVAVRPRNLHDSNSGKGHNV